LDERDAHPEAPKFLAVEAYSMMVVVVVEACGMMAVAVVEACGMMFVVVVEACGMTIVETVVVALSAERAEDVDV